MHQTKQTFIYLFYVLVLLLMFLPFITTFNEFLTRIFLQFHWYQMIERLIVPFEVRSIVVTVGWVGIEARGGPSSISIFHNGAWQRMWISWNCIGWQSAVLLFITLLTGLQGGYTRMSKVEAIIIGVLGTFLMNIFRISSVVIIFSSLGQLPALIAHDYFANIAIIIWLFFFWWLVYTYILVPGESK